MPGSRAAGPADRLVAFATEVAKEQYEVAVDLFADPRSSAPLFVIWVASFGGSLHAPVTTFFLLEVGASHMDVGWLGSMQATGTLVCAPLYGWILDKHSPFLAMALSAFMCSAGCLIRGLATNVTMLYFGMGMLGLGAANLWTMVLSYIASITETARRPIVISAFIFQVAMLSILGKALFPFVDWALLNLLGVTDNLLRMRIHMGECTAFCFYGFYKLVMARGVIEESTLVAKSAAALQQEARLLQGPADLQARGASDQAGGTSHLYQFMGISTVLVLQSFAVTTSNVLWPLFVKDNFAWTPAEFGYLLFVSSVVSALVVGASTMIEERGGRIFSKIVACGLAASAGIITFQCREPTFAVILVHSGTVIIFLASLTFMEAGLKSMASKTMPRSLQGLTFGAMTSVTCIGSMIGNPAATWLYQVSKSLGPNSLFGGGTLPMLVASSAMLVSIGLLMVLWKHVERAEKATPPMTPTTPQKGLASSNGNTRVSNA